MKKSAKKPKIKTEWDLTLLYKSPKDPQIEKDAQKIEAAYTAFEKKYRGKNFTKDEQSLAKALADYNDLADTIQSWKPFMYFHYLHEMNSANKDAEAQKRMLEARFVKASNQITFFDLELGEISAKDQRRFKKSEKLAPYLYMLERVWESAKYNLSEKEENILSLKSTPARSMWVSGVSSVLSGLTVPHEGKDIPLSEAFQKAGKIQNVKKRRELWHKSADTLMQVADFAEKEVNAVYTDKKINDELRGFKKPYDATLLAWENKEESVLSLIDTARKNFSTSHKFYKIKKKALGLKEMEPVDATSDLGTPKEKFTFKEATDIVREVFHGLNPKYGAVLDSFLEKGQIDAFPRKGKGGGAYQSDAHGLPTFVFLNYINDVTSIMTLAHEMGHAVHSERTNATQPTHYVDYTISVAEVASTFFEGFVNAKVMELLSEKDKKLALHDKIIDSMSNAYATAAMFQFESDLHTAIRSEGFVSKEKIAKMWNDRVGEYRGPAVKHIEKAGYAFVRVPHVRMHYYSYPYAFGLLISRALAERVLADPSYIKQVDQFLSAGGSKSPSQMFKDIGIDTTKSAFWEEGFKALKKDVDELEKLLK